MTDTTETALSLDELAERARQIRLNVLDMVYAVQSGHIGGSFSEAEILAALYYRILRIRPEEPKWADRDRFILSKGHACPGLYSVLAMKGFFPIETLATLRQFGSPLQGHPVIKCPGIDMTTGSLGIGFGIAVGIALEAARSNREYDVYTLVGDGELNEGIIWEVAGTANKYRLGNLVAIVDRNTVQNDGPCDDIMPTEPIDRKFEAFGWTVQKIDGHDMRQVVDALETARDHRDGPYCIVAYTAKGKGVSFMENDAHWHGKAPDESQYAAARAELDAAGAPTGRRA
ncbi:MAG: transketolase [Spirochaetaceae bacterium]|nr:MAG: transketolase [Spirochaetaceae bacterium]